MEVSGILCSGWGDEAPIEREGGMGGLKNSEVGGEMRHRSTLRWVGCACGACGGACLVWEAPEHCKVGGKVRHLWWMGGTKSTQRYVSLERIQGSRNALGGLWFGPGLINCEAPKHLHTTWEGTIEDKAPVRLL
eukprot:1152170-Pelagomonas_calceolata.AAC.5